MVVNYYSKIMFVLQRRNYIFLFVMIIRFIYGLKSRIRLLGIFVEQFYIWYVKNLVYFDFFSVVKMKIFMGISSQGFILSVNIMVNFS